jgi:CRISPR-associated endonuclease/helicase Cas3
VVDDDPVRVTVEGVGEWSTEETVDWYGPQRFVQLNQRYGRWGLALLETIVRLADIWCSARDECGPDGSSSDEPLSGESASGEGAGL